MRSSACHLSPCAILIDDEVNFCFCRLPTEGPVSLAAELSWDMVTSFLEGSACHFLSVLMLEMGFLVCGLISLPDPQDHVSIFNATKCHTVDSRCLTCFAEWTKSLPETPQCPGASFLLYSIWLYPSSNPFPNPSLHTDHREVERFARSLSVWGGEHLRRKEVVALADGLHAWDWMSRPSAPAEARQISLGT